MNFVVSHAVKENMRRKCYFIVCLFACFLVTLVSLISKTVVTQGSLIFLMLGEKETGEMDIILSPLKSERSRRHKNITDYFVDYAYINYTKYKSIIENNDAKDSLNTTTIRSNFIGKVGTGGKSADVVLINTTKEREIELGRSYPYGPMKEGECNVQKSLKYSSTDQVHLSITLDMSVFFRDTLINLYYLNQSHYNENITLIGKIPNTITIECKMANIFEDNYGKEGGDKDGLIFVEMEHFYKTIGEHMNPEIEEMFPGYSEIVKKINPNDYANTMIVNFPPNRINAYIESDFNVLLEKGAKYANTLTEQMSNIEHIDVSMPLIARMERYNYGSVLLNLVLNIIIISLFILSLILIYSLLLITLETNSFEFGILRLIGTTKRDIIFIIIFQCLAFSIPAFLIAFGCHFWVLSIINNSLKGLINTDLHLSFSTDSLFLACVVNFLSPICAAFFPIKSILGKNIASSLNAQINKTTGMKIEVISLEKKETKTFIIFGSLTFFYGASIYYFLPLSLISLNFSMIGFIFIFILLGIVVGFVMLSLNIENLLQKLITHILLFFTKSFTKMLIIKNLTAHRLKNRKTSLMYSLSVSLFIMTSVGLDIILQSVKKETINYRGSEALLSAYNEYFNPWQMRDSLKKMIDQGLIDEFSYRSPTLSNVCFREPSTIMNLGKSLSFNMDIKAISPSFFSATDPEPLRIDESQTYKVDKSFNLYTPSEQLYLSESKGKVGLSGIFKWEFNANLNDYFYIQQRRNKNQMTFLNKPAFIINAASGLQVNSEPSMMVQRTTALSIPHYVDLVYKCNKYFPEEIYEMDLASYEEFYIDKINLKINSKIPIKKAVDGISDIVNEDPNYIAKLWLYNNMRSRIDSISKMVFQIFYVVSTIVLFFCFFNLAASMTINIFDQKKEIAILRSLGMKKPHVTFVFVCEAVVLILTSSVIGTVIGSLISYTMSLQWQMFMNISVNYSVPVTALIIVISFSILGGILSTIVPATRMMKVPISMLVRNA